MLRFFAKILTHSVALSILLIFAFSYQKANAQCSKTWTFKVIKNTGCIKSTGRPVQLATSPVVDSLDSVAIKWDFGDGRGFVPGGDTVYSPAYLKGIHKIKMLITNNKSGQFLGDTCTLDSQNVFINGTGTPVVKAKTLKFCTAPFFVTLYDSTSGPIKSRQWLIKNSAGNSNGYFSSTTDSTGNNVDTFTIKKTGNYDVTLQVTDSFGCVTFDTLSKYIFLPVPLQPDICAFLTVGRINRDSITGKFTHDNLATGSLDTSGATYKWYFGDGSTSTLSDPSHVYTGIDSSKAKDYSVKLVMTLKNGCVDSVTLDSIVTQYFVSPDTSKYDFCTGMPAPFHVTQSGKKGHNSFSFTTSVSSTRTPVDPNNANFTFSASGMSDMTIHFGTPNPKGCQPNVYIPAVFNILPPKAGFSSPDLSNTTCTKPARVYVQTTTPYKGAKYYWYVYDTSVLSPKLILSKVVTTDTTTLVFGANDSGFFSVKLVVVDPNGGKLTCEDSITRASFISINSPVPDFKIKDTIVCAGKTLSMMNLTSPKDTTLHPYTYSWSVSRRNNALVSRYSGKKPTIELDSIGIFDLQLTVTLSKTCRFLSPKHAAYVQGTSGTIVATPLNTCIGSGTAKLSVKLNSWSPNSPIYGPKGGYLWKSSDSAKTVFKPTTAETKIDSTDTTVTIDVSGSKQKDFSMSVLIVNSSGCSTIVAKPGFLHLGTKAVIKAPKIGCSRTPIQFSDQSLYSPDTFYWEVTKLANPGAKVTIDSVYGRKPFFSFSDTGFYTIKHRIGKGTLDSTNGCYKDTTDTIHIVHPRAYFMSFNQNSGCAPQIISFDSIQQTQNVSMYYWNYGDKNVDSTTDTSGWYHIYSTNSPSGFTVQLVVKDVNGCLDTFVRPAYIHLNGPVPSFTISAHSACGDSTVTITNNSINITDLSLDFRDGSPPNNGNFTTITHKYTYTDLSKDSLVYFLQMVASDNSSSTCFATYTDSIKLYRPPIAHIATANNLSGCAPYTVHFQDVSLYNDTTRDEWDFNNDGIMDASGVAYPAYTYTTPGVYTVRLFVSTGHCADSITMTNYITVFGKPVANFTSDKDTTCPTDIYTFTPNDNNPDNSTISNYAWDFGDTQTVSSSPPSDSSAQHQYKYGGSHDVQLTVTNSNGCSDTLLKPAFVYTYPFHRPDSPIVLSVSVDLNAQSGNTGAVIVKWKKETSGNFSKYDLFRQDMGTALDPGITDPNTDSFYDASTDVYDNSYGYDLDKSDACGFTSLPGAPHYTVNLHTTPNPVGTVPYIKLAWTSYVGWQTLTSPSGKVGPIAYQIWRKDNNNPSYALINTVITTGWRTSGSDTTYTDSNNICNGMYRYYVVAVHPTDSSLNSNSNRDSSSPNYTFQTTRLDLLYTTVVNDQYTVTKWTGVMQPNVKAFIIDRMDSTGKWDIGYDSVGPNQDSFVDYKAKVTSLDYHYRVKVLDKCGNITDGKNPLEAGPSNPGTSMYLSAGVVGDCPNEQFSFLWTPYDSFSAGRDHYVLQIKDPSGNWINYKNLDALKDSTGDDSIHLELNGPACYRVVAWSKLDLKDTSIAGQTGEQSISNSECLLNCSRLYFPDAFTPNGDGLNDSFFIISVALFNGINPKDLQFSFKIYDRWGELVWSTNDIHGKWGGQFGSDRGGKAYQDCPMDIYVYQVEAHGMDKQIFFKRGVISIVK